MRTCAYMRTPALLMGLGGPRTVPGKDRSRHGLGGPRTVPGKDFVALFEVSSTSAKLSFWLAESCKNVCECACVSTCGLLGCDFSVLADKACGVLSQVEVHQNDVCTGKHVNTRMLQLQFIQVLLDARDHACERGFKCVVCGRLFVRAWVLPVPAGSGTKAAPRPQDQHHYFQDQS